MKKTLNLGKKIQYARTEAGLSQKELAARLKLSDKTISAYEVGRAQPGVEVLKKIGKLTGRPVVYFIDDSQKENLDLQYKLASIEKELQAIKRELKKKKAY